MMLHQEFHELFAPPLAADSDAGKKRSDRTNRLINKLKHRNKYYSIARESKLAQGVFHQLLQQQPPPVQHSVELSSALTSAPSKVASLIIELNNNPSQFSVFAAIRQSVLEKQLKNAIFIYNQTFGRINAINESDEEEEEAKNNEQIQLKVPKVVSLGLCVAFQLIQEARLSHPVLCGKALRALLDSLQGLLPEALKNEPNEVISPLFEMLIDLASTFQQTIAIDKPSPSTSSSSSSSSQLKSYSCSALLSLVVARGDTGKMLSAICALLTSPNLFDSCEEIETPNILISLQRSVHAVLLGKINRPDWLTHGFPNNSLCDSFHVQILTETSNHLKSSLTFDGKFLYIYSGNVIYKIGSGYRGTVKGQLICSKSFGSSKSECSIGWIGFVQDHLYIQNSSWSKNELIKLDKDLLKEVGKVNLGNLQSGSSVCASDTENLILITSTKDDCFVIKTLKPSLQQCPSSIPSTSYLMPVIHELTIKLSHKCLSVCGSSAANIFETAQASVAEQVKPHGLRPVDISEAEDIVQIAAGKDFAVIRTQTGKILFTGKSQSLGIKQNGANNGKWNELPITKSPKIAHISVGHEGNHALLVTEDGTVFFVGIAKRGEDGEQSKARRQPKATKPKKMIKMEGKQIETTACNHGTSALVTKSGELYMFGKDSQHTDKSTGLVTALKNIVVTQVAMGKAHTLVLTNKGHVYSFGISNKGQCGHDMMQSTLSVKEMSAQEESEDLGEQQIDMSEDVTESLCSFGQHRWKYDKCMICTLCGECTGYGLSCIASGKAERNPGLECGCGPGDAGCADCGCCRTCESVSKEILTVPQDNEGLQGQAMALGSGERLPALLAFPEEMPPPKSALGDSLSRLRRLASAMEKQVFNEDVQFPKPQASANGVLNEHEYEEVAAAGRPLTRTEHVRMVLRGERRLIGLGRRLKHSSKMYRNFIANAAASKANNRDEAAGNEIAEGSHEIIDRAVCNVINFDHDQGSDGESMKLTSLPPTKLTISHRIVQIACGLHHSVLLTASGEVYTFGSNQHGQLGHGDFLIREVPTKVHISSTITQISAGNNHTVLLGSNGEVYTFGSNQKAQLGRSPSAIDYAWNAVPGAIPNIGPQFGRKATWISASGDYTLIKFDEALINPVSLPLARVLANRKCIVIVPPKCEDLPGNEQNERTYYRSLIINRSDGSCKTFNDKDQLELSNFSAICLDNLYDILWTYNSETQTISRHNIIAVEAKIPQQTMMLPSILLPELSLPQKSSVLVNRTTAALNLLCTLDTLTATHQLGWTVQDDEQTKNNIAKAYSKDDFSSVCRFESHGGGWGFSSHSIEAIRFMADSDILLGGFGLFGGRGEYTAKLKLFDIGMDGGEQEGDGEILAETEEIPYECAAKQKFPILFDEPVSLQANRWYVAWARISGPSSDCGSSGQSVVNTEDQVIFYFKSSKKSNNGTDVNAGQIPQLLYKVNYLGNDTLNQPNSSRNEYDAQEEPTCIISREFSLSVTSDCFYSLLKVLRWSWQSFKVNLCDINSCSSGNVINSMIIDLKHLTYVCCASLHLLKIYINEVFSNEPRPKFQSNSFESAKLAECVYDVRSLLKLILSEPPEHCPRLHHHSAEVNSLVGQIMEESHDTFLACYHAFYPTSSLRWRGLCDLLFPQLTTHRTRSSHSDFLLSSMLAALCRPSIRLTHTFPMIYNLDVSNLQSPTDLLSPTSIIKELNTFQQQILNEKILEKTDKEGCHPGIEATFRDVINKLLELIGEPIEVILQREIESKNDLLQEEETENSSQLVEHACNLILTVISELVAQVTKIGFDSQAPIGQQLHITPSRFSRLLQNRTWNTGNGSPDAICFSVDRSGISIAGVTVYGGIGNEWHYELELLDYTGAPIDEAERIPVRDVNQSHWRTIEMTRGSYSFEDKTVDVCEIKFDRMVPILPNFKYAIRLRNHGPRTNNGDAGLTHVRGPDGTTFTFSDCSLSFNGTNHTRGQIPQILYYSTPQSVQVADNSYALSDEIPRKNAIAISESVITLTVDLLQHAQQCASSQELIWEISSSLLIRKLLPHILAYLSPMANSDPKSATQILNLIQHLLPLVVNLNKSSDQNSGSVHSPPLLMSNSPLCTTSRHYAIVESDHPYKPASVNNYKVNFPPTVKWMSIEFDSRCGTAQVEDILQIYIPPPTSKLNADLRKINKNFECNALWPVLRKFQGKSNNWPTASIIIPGNELVFSLETASDYVKDDRVSYYGFRCQVVGYDSPTSGAMLFGLQYLEQELAYLAGVCVSSLLKKNINLPKLQSKIEINENAALRTFEIHSQLLSKGLLLSHSLTIHEALDNVVPLANEHPFLKDFCMLTHGSSGARLAKWFQCESFVDPSQCEVHCSYGVDQELQCGWPTVITVITRDQYGNIVNVPNLRVEVCAQPFHVNTNVQAKHAKQDAFFGGLSVTPPPTNIQYSITAKDKMFYHAITMMKPFDNYSFEELRFMSPVKPRTIETMLVRSNNDGTYTANWTPSTSGWYQLKITVDGISVNATQSVQVGEPPKGVTLPQVQSSFKQSKTLPCRSRKFIGRNSSGLRIRSLPSLQSEQIGTIGLSEIITIIEEIQNDDGVWVRLSPESVKKFCNMTFADHNVEAWCLQYNQHLGKTLLVPVGEPKPIILQNGPSNATDQNMLFLKSVSNKSIALPKKKKSKDPVFKKLEIPGYFHVVKCGVTGHNVRCRPNLRAPAVGMIVLGNVVGVSEQVTNSEGTWVKLNEESVRRFCFNTEGDAWSLARTINDTIYLQHEAEVMHTDEEDESKFQINQNQHITSKFKPSNQMKIVEEIPTIVAGSSSVLDKSASSGKGLSVSQPSINTESEIESLPYTDSFLTGQAGSSSLTTNAFTEFESSDGSVNETRSTSSASATTGSRIAALQRKFLSESETNLTSFKSLTSPHSKDALPELHGVNVKEIAKAMTHDIQSPLLSPAKKSPVVSQNSSPGLSRRSSGSTPPIPIKPVTVRRSLSEKHKVEPFKTFTQKGTQTSPPEESTAIFGQGVDSARTSSQRSSSCSPKTGFSPKEHRTSKPTRTKKEKAHATCTFTNPGQAVFQATGSREVPSNITVKEAMSNSIAECIRAVFAAFIWHEGILHDAVAASSYLKFNPEVTKDTVKSIDLEKNQEVVRRFRKKLESKSVSTKEQKAKFRHSVEVSQLSALQQQECYANANLEPNKNLTETETVPLEGAVTGDAEASTANLDETNEEGLMIPETLINLLKLWEVVSKLCINTLSQPPLTIMTPAATSPPSTPLQMFNRIQNNARVIQTNVEDAYLSKLRFKAARHHLASNQQKGCSFNRYLMNHRNLFGEAALANGGYYELKEAARLSLCELCGNNYPYPVTHHMRRAHPGCGEHAGGKGYNSSGSFCGGWAGHCGDGGFDSSNWYLICDKCRDKYLSQKKQNVNRGPVKGAKSVDLKPLSLQSPNKANVSSPTNQMEIHQLMKENALFLLRMVPANDSSGAFSYSSLMKQSNDFPLNVSGFHCLESLGIQHSAYHQRLAEEHLTEDEIKAIQSGRPSNFSSEKESSVEPEVQADSLNEQRKVVLRSNFHRSVSIGLNEHQQDRTSQQRKRATSNESSHSIFLCQSSPTLINLVHSFESRDSQPSTPQNVKMQKVTSFPLDRPVIQFILQQHSLEGLLATMRNALRKAACRTHALHALNWLLRNVSQPVALHDLMWFFVSSLTSNSSYEVIKEESEENANNSVNAVNSNQASAVDGFKANSIEQPRRDDIDYLNQNQAGICQHPLSDLSIAGEGALPLSQAFHTFLQTVSDLMPLLPMGSALQQIAIRCFCLQFDSNDHLFLHQCHVFSNISKIFSRTDEENINGCVDEALPHAMHHLTIETFQDLTSQVDIKASSRQAMVGSLTDNSTETFWESGDEDRNKTKVITINNNAAEVTAKFIYMHIDNCRDLGAKVSHVTFKWGDNSNEQMTKLKVVDVENRFAGWIHAFLPQTETPPKTIKLEMKGPDNTLRLRQVKILGYNNAKVQVDIGRPIVNSQQIQQINCEAETLKVFRLLTSQVFGKLITGEAEDIPLNSDQVLDSVPSDASNDLREHMVGILFSRSGKLTQLQKQVCSHIVQAIRVETIRLREEWEALLCSKSSSISISGEMPTDAYCFEALSMVLALSGSAVGRQYLALQNDLLLDLFSLLHTGSARVQRQVISLLRRVLPEIKPSNFATMLGISSLPPRDIISSSDNEEFDIHTVGIIDVFLACIAKALTVQTKVKGLIGGTSKSATTITLATSIHPRDHLADRWWLRGCMSRKLAECIINLLKDMTAGKLSDCWASVTKNAIAQNILNLTRMNEQYRIPSECIKTPTLWISLASLCVLEQEHAEKLSSSHWVSVGDQVNGNQANQPTRPFCDNHDDGETHAIILCNSCGNLCAECDRFLHLHRKTRNHQRQVFKEEEEAIRVDLHEGCGRTKLFWVMALADSKTLKAMVEFRGENTRTKSLPSVAGQMNMTSTMTGVCRFCGSTGNTGLLAIGNICGEAECQEHAKNACSKFLSCGHQCGGIKNEDNCLPCLHGCSAELKQDADDMCMICFCEALSCAPVIQLKCGHLFHQHCCRAVLSNRWPGPRITFAFSLCPICQSTIEHPSLEDLLKPIRLLYEDVHRKALMRLEYEGLHRCEAIATPGARFFNDPAGYAMDRYAYYVCCKCKKAYYGGEARCDQINAGADTGYDPNELVCGGCSDVSRAQMCPKHGTDFLEYKCRYCCSVAVFFCFGTTHFCNACHDDFQKLTNMKEFPKCPAGPRGKQLEGEECPLHVKHPPTGEEFALGCGVCRNAHTF